MENIVMEGVPIHLTATCKTWQQGRLELALPDCCAHAGGVWLWSAAHAVLCAA
jgi:hypothetical protein